MTAAWSRRETDAEVLRIEIDAVRRGELESGRELELEAPAPAVGAIAKRASAAARSPSSVPAAAARSGFCSFMANSVSSMREIAAASPSLRA